MIDLILNLLPDLLLDVLVTLLDGMLVEQVGRHQHLRVLLPCQQVRLHGEGACGLLLHGLGGGQLERGGQHHWGPLDYG